MKDINENELDFEKNIADDDSNETDNDINYELDDEIVEESGIQHKLKKLREELKAEKKQSQEYLTGWQKERASFVNFKNQEEVKRSERLSAMKTNLIADFLPVLDSFDMAFSNREAWEKVDSSWRVGVEYIHTQFLNTLEQYNIQAINTIDVAFNPMIHEPVKTIATDDQSKDEIVASVVQKGYQSGSIVMRPAKVHIYKYEN